MVKKWSDCRNIDPFSPDNASVNMDKDPRMATVVSILVNSASLGIFDQFFLSLLSTAHIACCCCSNIRYIIAYVDPHLVDTYVCYEFMFLDA